MPVTLPLTIDTKYSGLPVHLSLEKRVNLLSAGSGKGKTLIIKALTDWFPKHGFMVFKLDCNSVSDYDLNAILEVCGVADVILIDNIGLFPYRELIPALSKLNILVVAAGSYVSGVHFEDYIQVRFTLRGYCRDSSSR